MTTAHVSGKLLNNTPLDQFFTFPFDRSDEIGKNIIRAAKEIITKQQTDYNDKVRDDKLEKIQLQFNSKIVNLETKLCKMEDKIDLVLKKLTKY